MTDSQRTDTREAEFDTIPEAVIKKRRGISLVWLIPLVALLIGGWLAYKTISEKGSSITIAFKDGSGIEPGKTKIMYKAVEVGLVKAVTLSPDLSHVEVTAELHKDMEPHLRETTQFWVVKPQIGLKGITGLETLLSGVYIGMAPGTGKPQRQFVGLSQAPMVQVDTPGRRFMLLADQLGSLQANSPIYFRDVQVGEVLGSDLSGDFQNVQIPIFIYSPYEQLVRSTSRFWRRSGLNVSLSAKGVDVQMESLAALALGGVTFETPGLENEQILPSPANASFRLYESHAEVIAAGYTQKVAYEMFTDGSVRGLSIGAPVEFRGIQVGVVNAIRVVPDKGTGKLRTAIVFDLEPERLQASREYNPTRDESVTRKTIDRLVEQGLRASLQTGNLLTGQLYVDLNFYPAEAGKQQVTYGGEYPVFPSIPSTIDQLQITAQDLLAKLKQLPLDQIADELLGTIKGANHLLNAPEWADTLRSLDATLKDLQKLSHSLDQHLTPLVTEAERALKSARQTLDLIEPGAPMTVDVANTLESLSGA
ncbi:MAG TPA: MlaD family protein, partial [Candidatus Competibacteraceae bacterium]|nr:MlaD family protein [Candidatus Competibacteraceae bacterium]